MAEKQMAITATIIAAQCDKIFRIEFELWGNFKWYDMVSLNELSGITDGTRTAGYPFVTECRPSGGTRTMTF